MAGIKKGRNMTFMCNEISMMINDRRTISYFLLQSNIIFKILRIPLS
jgi:hypothetical protein